MRLGAERRLIRDRRGPERLRRGVEPLVVGLGAAVAEALLGVLLEERLEVLPRVRLKRLEELAELHGRGGVLHRDVAAVLDPRARRRPGLEVDEEVALEEDARADLHLRVLVDREALLLDLHGHPGLAVAVGQRMDVGDLADVDARLAHRRLLLEVVRRLEGRVDDEWVRERVVLREPEEGEHEDQHGSQEPRSERRDRSASSCRAGSHQGTLNPSARSCGSTWLRFWSPVKVGPKRNGGLLATTTWLPPANLRLHEL